MQVATTPAMPHRVRKRRRRRRRRIWRRLLGVLLLLLVGACGFTIWRTLPAWRAVQDARRQVQALQAARTTLRHVPTAADLTTLDGHVQQLAGDLQTVDAAWNFWREPALLLSQVSPSLHDQLQQVDLVVALGMKMTQASHGLLQTLTPVLASDGASGNSVSTVALVSRLVQVRPVLQSLAQQFQAADQERRQIDGAAIPASLQSGMRLINDYLPQAPAAMRALAALPTALGADGSRTYLLVPQNPEDLRASGGYIGTVATLRVDRGHIRLVSAEASGLVDQLYRPNVIPPLPMALHGWGAWYFRDANWSADYPTSAQLLAIFYRLGTHQRVDGVIAITPAVLRAIFALTGPVPVPGYNTVLTAENAFQIIDLQVNRLNRGKVFAVAAYKAVFARLLTVGPRAMNTAVLDLLRQDVLAHALQLFSYDPSVESAIRGIHADGAIDPTTGDYLYVVDTNLSTNKINQLIQERITYRAVIQLDHTIHASLTIRYVNDADARNVPIQNGHPDYQEFVRVFVPKGSTLTSVTGLDQPWPTLTVHHKTQFSGYFALPAHQVRTIAFQYQIPRDADPGETYTLYVQRQPGAGAIALDAAVATVPEMGLGAGQAHLQTTLTRDAELSVHLIGGVATNPSSTPPPPEPLLTPGAHPEPWVSVPTGLVPRLGPMPPPVQLG